MGVEEQVFELQVAVSSIVTHFSCFYLWTENLTLNMPYPFSE